MAESSNSVLLSIVIANYNYGRFIETTIRSVVEQCVGTQIGEDGVPRLQLATGELIELIICDAASKDNSVEVIRKYAGLLPPNASAVDPKIQPQPQITWWCSEKDGGQSDAFNKGFSHATGRFLTWLNADDALIKGSLAMIAKAVRCNPRQEWFVGGCVHVDPDMNVLRCTLPRRFSKYEADGGSLNVFSPSSVFSKDLLDRVGGINVKFKGAMDTELWYKFYRREGIVYKAMPGFLFAFRLHPESRTTGCLFADSEMSKADNPVHAEFAYDMKMLASEFPARHRRTKWGSILHMQWWPWIKSRIITFMHRGQSVLECGYL